MMHSDRVRHPKPQSQEVFVDSSDTTELHVTLQKQLFS